jgi:hypothetical protein
VWNYNDQDMLRVPSLVDIHDVVEEKKGWSRHLWMETLAEDLLGFQGRDEAACVGRSDWEASWLEEEQVQYASVDAFLSFRMGKALHVWNW